jgi:predicted transcriptional regulator
MKTLRVRDIMTTDVHTLAASMSAADAARFMMEAGISGAPVKDGGRIVGVISTTDVTDPSRWGETSPSVGSVMTPMIYAVRPSDPVMAAVRLMVLENIHRALVVSEQGNLLGIVTPMDVLRAILRDERVQEYDTAIDGSTRRHGDPASGVGFVDLRSFELLGSAL